MIKMIDIPFSEDMDWLDALWDTIPKGYRKTRSGKYEAFISERSKTIFFGTYDTIAEAKEQIFNYRIDRLIRGVEVYGLNIDDGVVFMDNYIAFREGLIFNLYGERMIGTIDRNGYRHGIFNRRNVSFHRIIATLFCYRRPGCDYVNHIDGNKDNNAAYNLEWVTRSENTIHSFETGLQTTIGKTKIFTNEEKEYIKEHCYDYYKDVATALNRNPGTVRKYMEKYRKVEDND